MAKITKYEIVENESLKDLVYAINLLVRVGWQPYGNIKIIQEPRYNTNVYIQSVVLIDETVNTP
jgi:hypothetical protein